MLKRTPIIAIFIAGLLSITIFTLFEIPSRPFTGGQITWLFFFSFLTSMGIAMFFDPNAKKAKEEFLKINFYEEKE